MDWTYWLGWGVSILIGTAWFLKSYVVNGLLAKGQLTENKKSALELTQKERDEALDQVAKLEERINELEKESRIVQAIPEKSERQKDNAEEPSPEEAILEDSSSEITRGSSEAESRDIEPLSLLADAWKAFKARNYDKGMGLIEQYNSTLNNEYEQASWLSWGNYSAFRTGNERAFRELKQQAEDHPYCWKVQINWALALDYTGETDDAILHLSDVLSRCEESRGQVALATSLADLHSKLSQEGVALSIIGDVLNRVEQPSHKATLYKKAGELYEHKGELSTALKVYERALHHNPSDTNLRFNVAYTYGENSAPKMALYHYRKMIEIREDADVALNNAGVTAKELSLPITSIQYLRRSEQLENTLAVANLASRFLTEGFVSEAESILDEATEKPNVHDNVYREQARLRDEQERERKEVEAIERLAEEAHKRRCEYGAAVLQALPDPTLLSGRYEGEPGVLSIAVNEDGKVTGKLLLPNDERVAEVTGQVKGSCIDISWKLPLKVDTDKTIQSGSPTYGELIANSKPSRSESGFLVYQDGCLRGYTTQKEETLDPEVHFPSRETEWNVSRVADQ